MESISLRLPTSKIQELWEKEEKTDGLFFVFSVIDRMNLTIMLLIHILPWLPGFSQNIQK